MDIRGALTIIATDQPAHKSHNHTHLHTQSHRDRTPGDAEAITPRPGRAQAGITDARRITHPAPVAHAVADHAPPNMIVVDAPTTYPSMGAG